VITGYTILSELHRGRKSVLLRAVREADGEPVVLKALLNPHPDDVARFRHEYEIALSLSDLDGVVKPYAFEQRDGESVMVMEDFGGETVRPPRKAGVGMSEFLEIALPLATTLRGIHQRDIVHKDINPNNILRNRATGVVKLTDFGLASRLSRENQTAVSLHLLEGTLAYMSPEQTGRMNRAIDYRSDFYSLGATFYELLVGRPPFVTTDAAELVHHHIAKQAVSPHELKPDIPPVVSAIVMKLLAKTAEERYQSAHGICADLERCAAGLAADGVVADFVLGQSDIKDRLRIPQTLYGRAAEVDVLLEAVEGAMRGPAEFILVSGYPGIGKSSLIQEVHKPVIRQRAFFVQGKCDQYQRNVPYASVIQAFQQLIRQLLTESEARVAGWRARLAEALGANGQILVDVIPEVELIIGKQSPVPPLGPTEARNRFNLVMQRFVDALARPEHPLVMFIDDLQWADAASLNLVELLATDPDRKFFSIIGAYRGNEVSESHPLRLTIDRVKQAGVATRALWLDGLRLEDITQLIGDALG
jgi:tRNA A-37 threonylcarbamoyl transferase component Bud32